MNGFERMAQAYEKMLRGGAEDEGIKQKIKVLRLVAGLTEDEIDALFDTSAFNSIVKGYLIAAMGNAELTDEQRSDIQNGLRFALDEMSAGDARRKYEQ